MAKRFKAAVIGGSGYGGAELIRRLLIHPDVELVRVASVDFVGEPLGAAHPNLDSMTDLRFENLAPRDAVAGCDIALLALPHKVTAAKVPELLATCVKIVDMSGDFRLRDAAAYERYYGAKHPHPDLLGTFVYGLPELNREKIRVARCVASPGCFATTIELALLPLAGAGFLGGVVHVQGITGSSGAGVAPTATTHHPSRSQNLRTYKPLEHQHIPEIVETLADAGARDVTLRFVPVSAPLARGIFATAYVELHEDIDEPRLCALYDDTFANAPFVRRPKKRLPEVVAVSGSNFAEVGFAVSEARAGVRTAAAFAVTDNLIKGGAWQAIQNMNLMLGLDERASLEDPGGWP
ncbi:MAG: N-acetyl-gamma-glutamyl-phosphate reductase [Deltaproteobacteria bacterium]|nr:N-acetyl-gamma-glutamyl-phosphate reductase [Deltaproteobacteria bacterium]